MIGLGVVHACSERCITLHTVPVPRRWASSRRRPKCLMHEASTPADATHLKRGSAELPLTKTVAPSVRSPGFPAIDSYALTIAPSGTTPIVAIPQIAINSFRAIATMAMRRVRP